MRALSIRQPYAELILRGIKTVEYRSQPTRIIGERFWIYASKRRAEMGGEGDGARGRAVQRFSQSPARPLSPSLHSDNLELPTAGVLTAGVLTAGPPEWMLELAEQIKLIPADLLTAGLPTGVIVGSAVIERITQIDGMYRWHLADVERAKTLRKPWGHPQPVWFRA